MPKPAIAYEHISQEISNPTARARQLLQAGWNRAGQRAVKLDEPMPWNLSDPSLRSFSFLLHALDMIDVLLQAYDATEDPAWLKPALRIGRDWMMRHPRGPMTDRTTPFAWYDMAVGMRSFRLAYIFDAGRAEGLISDDEMPLWQQRLLEHAEYLLDDTNIALHNNHGLYQIAGQLALGRRLAGQGAPYQELHAQGLTRIAAMLDQQFAADGVHLEHSPDYHRMVYQTLRGLMRANLLGRDDLQQRMMTIERALSWFICPDSSVANLGDSDGRQLNSGKPAVTNFRWSTEEMRFAVSGGTLGQWPDHSLALFPMGGYAVVRHPYLGDWPQNDSYLIFNAAYHSRTHKHADDLSFIWNEFGDPVLVDAGRYGYLGKTKMGSQLWSEGFWYEDPNRVYVERTRAHNCLEFDGQDYLRRGRKPYGSALTGAVQSHGVTAVRGEIRATKSVRYSRTLILAPRQWLIVLDSWHDSQKNPHQLRQWFQLHPRWTTEATENGYRATAADAPPLHVLSLIDGPYPGPKIRGQIDPMQGWWSPSERKLEPLTSVHFRLDDTFSGSIATLFAFGTDVTVEPSISRVNTLGRAFQTRFVVGDREWNVSLTAAVGEESAAGNAEGVSFRSRDDLTLKVLMRQKNMTRPNVL